MVAYTGIQGQNILITATDPSNPTEGQIWYNSTSNLLKGYQFANVNAWASGGNMGTGRRQVTGTGTQTAALGFGGISSPGPGPSLANTEKYDGTSWTTTGSLNIAKQVLAGAGTQPAGLAFGGSPTPTGTEEYIEGNATKTFTTTQTFTFITK